jgi:hypothetical protein
MKNLLKLTAVILIPSLAACKKDCALIKPQIPIPLCLN